LRKAPFIISVVAATAVVALGSAFTYSYLDSPERAREDLAKLNISYDANSFVDVCKTGDIRAIELFIKAGTPLNTSDSKDAHCLTAAAYNDQVKVIDYLLTQNVDVNLVSGKDDKQTHPLHAAVFSKEDNPEIILKLLAAGSNPYIADGENYYPIFYTVRDNKLKKFKALFDPKGMDKVIKNSPLLLMSAILLADQEIIFELAKYKFDPFLTMEKEGKFSNSNALSFLISKKNLEVIKTLHKHNPIDWSRKDKKENTPLFNAASVGYFEGVQFMVDSGANVNDLGEDGFSILDVAMQSKNEDLIEYLVKKGAKRAISDNIVRAEEISQRMLTIEKSIMGGYSLRGFINRATSWSDFPDAANLVRNAGAAGNQLLDINVNGRALLATVESNYSTTGYFSMSVKKLGMIDTTVGRVPVYVEFRDLNSLEREYNRLNFEMNRLAAKETGSLISKKLRTAWELKRKHPTRLELEEMAALLVIKEGGKKTNTLLGHSILWSKQKNVLNCHLKEKYKLTQSTWKNMTQFLLSGDDNPNLMKFTNCQADKHQSRWEFHKCMCGGGDGDRIYTVDEDSKRDMAKEIVKAASWRSQPSKKRTAKKSKSSH
jgi:ankyrin repeat protein